MSDPCVWVYLVKGRINPIAVDKPDQNYMREFEEKGVPAILDNGDGEGLRDAVYSTLRLNMRTRNTVLFHITSMVLLGQASLPKNASRPLAFPTEKR